jgi:hypothetical protein
MVILAASLLFLPLTSIAINNNDALAQSTPYRIIMPDYTGIGSSVSALSPAPENSRNMSIQQHVELQPGDIQSVGNIIIIITIN